MLGWRVQGGGQCGGVLRVQQRLPARQKQGERGGLGGGKTVVGWLAVRWDHLLGSSMTTGSKRGIGGGAV